MAFYIGKIFHFAGIIDLCGIISDGSRGEKKLPYTEIQVPSACVPSGGSERGLFPHFLQLLVVACDPWHCLTCSCLSPVSASIAT